MLDNEMRLRRIRLMGKLSSLEDREVAMSRPKTRMGI